MVVLNSQVTQQQGKVVLAGGWGVCVWWWCWPSTAVHDGMGFTVADALTKSSKSRLRMGQGVCPFLYLDQK